MLPELKENKKKKVAAYARVSTSQEVQLQSLQNQREYYINKIKNNPDWELVGIFIDEGISGTGLKNRDGMKELMRKAKRGEVDLILCKSISRFARNTADLLKTTKKLKEYGTEVVFEKEGLSSVSGDGELMLSLMGVFAQTESESISTNIKWRIQKDREQGLSTPHPNVLGYRWEGNELKINEEEAEVVREIYEMYEDGMSGRQIARELNKRIEKRKQVSTTPPSKKPSTNPNNQSTAQTLDCEVDKGFGVEDYCFFPGSLFPGSLLDRHFDSTSIYYILRNPLYSGDLLLGKYYKTSPINGKVKKNKGERDMYLVEENHEAIIEKTKWEEIQEIIKERTKDKCQK